MRADGGEFSLCCRRGGVGKVLGRSLDAAFSSASDGSRDDGMDPGHKGGEFDCVGEDGDDGGCDDGRDWSPRRWIASLDAFSRIYLRSASVRPGRASLMSTRRTSVGGPFYWY